MRSYDISQSEILELRVAHKSAKRLRFSPLIIYKIHTIILLGIGMSPSEVSEILFLNEDTIVSYFDKYTTGGLVCLLKTNYIRFIKKDWFCLSKTRFSSWQCK